MRLSDLFNKPSFSTTSTRNLYGVGPTAAPTGIAGGSATSISSLISNNNSYNNNSSGSNNLISYGSTRMEYIERKQQRKLNQLKTTISDSLSVLTLPKSPLFGVKSKSQQFQSEDLLKQKTFTPKSFKSAQFFDSNNGLSPRSTNNVGGRISSPTSSIAVPTRKYRSNNWMGLRNQLNDEMEAKKPFLNNTQSLQLFTSTARSSISKSGVNVINTSNNNNTSLKERVRNINNQFYTKFVSANAIDNPITTSNVFDDNITATAVAAARHQIDSILNSKTSTEEQELNPIQARNPPAQAKHRMISSICMAQIKPIKGGKVKKADKLKFQNYYDSVTERLQDFMLSRTKGDEEKFEHANYKLDLNKIKYEPINVKKQELGQGNGSIEEVRRMYLKDKMNEQQENLLSMIAGHEVVESLVEQERQKKKQHKIDGYSKEYKRKTFFVVRDDFGQKPTKQSNTNPTQNEDFNDEEVLNTHKPVEMEGEEEALLQKQQKFRRVRKEMCDVLRRHYVLGLTIEESKKEKVFVRLPFKRENAEEFFKYVKQNDVDMVEKLLNKDKYLVHDFDNTLQTPLHWAAKRGFIEIAGILIDFKAEVNSSDEIGRTPLYFAYREGHNQMGKLLLMNKASPWSTKRNPIDQVIHSRLSNDMTTIKIAQQIHLAMKMANIQQQAKIWEESKYLFDDKRFVRTKKKQQQQGTNNGSH